MKSSPLKTAFLYTVLVAMSVVALFPIYWMLNTSLKSNAEIYRIDPTFWPETFTLESYRKLFEGPFPTQIGNSLLVGFVVSVLSIAVSVFAAYAIARMRFRGRKAISKSVLYAYLMPRAVLFIPLYMLVSRLQLADSLWALVLVYPTITIPYATWILVPYFASVPVELEEAAMIDGAGRLRAMLQITLPLSAPAIAATTVFSFTLCWSEYLYGLVMINSFDKKTIPLGLADMINGDVFAWGPLMGGAVIATLPIVALYLAANRWMVSGLALGGVK
ncbi:carbohydrate ABC transporter permease [Streptomyces paludis]|uniref:Carbohydrate ABC transporter permease n=1 Tax=Streptomyces paludis TaxID=2282738 RepID=A0A345HY04_9ACTN|nr:carbohydrate ABC transporter permease [Streptomyces paludis]AXG81578.1 carbohydrate ABC transporter permease [Streptomyces paludis]